MIKPESKLFILTKPVEGIASGDTIGKLRIATTAEQAGATFEALDCFDQSIRKSGRLLIETKGEMQLFQEDGTLLTQPAGRKGDFVADLADGPVKDALGSVSPLRSLMVVGSGTCQRNELALIDDEDKTHARAYFEVLDAPEAGTQVTLASVQGLRGYQKAYDALVAHLTPAEGQETHSFGDLYKLLFPGLTEYDPKPEIVIPDHATAFDTANTIIHRYIAIARQNEPGVIADTDTEFLHDYRVSLRKVRSVVSLFRGVYSEEQTRTLKTAFSDMMAPTGPLRDLDVYLLERQQYYDLLPETLHSGLTLMFKMFEKERTQAQKKIMRRFKSPAYEKAISKLSGLFADTSKLDKGPNAERLAHDYACEMIWKRYRKVCKIARTIDDETEDEYVHELRINCKKLRYLMEFFAPVFPPEAFKPLIKPLKKLQDNLGLFNDYSVQQDALQEFVAGRAAKGGKQDMVIAKSIGALIVVLHQRQAEERAKVLASFAHFDSTEVQDQFRLLFHEKGV
ncbi:CHAD domain-containing protein [Rhodobacteraceae bacterium NNCM2]|nr:CHAD domain-containing protein [Coraliihabitans acroporae]